MFDFQNFCRDHNVPTLDGGHHHTHQGWLQTHCPFCTSGQDGWHLGFSLEYGNCNCWRCGNKTIWNVISRLLKTSDKHRIRQTLAKYQTHNKTVPKQPQTRKKHIGWPRGIVSLQKIHRKYLQSRGYDWKELVKTWGLRGTNLLGGSWSWRIIAPIHNSVGDVTAYIGRAIDPERKPKYKVSDHKDILEDPKAMLYGIEKIDTSVVIVEGPADVWRLGPGAVAVLGIDWNPEQAETLRHFKNRYIMFDPGQQAQKRAEGLAEWLSLYTGNTEIIEDLQSDPGDLSEEEAGELMESLGFPRKTLA